MKLNLGLSCLRAGLVVGPLLWGLQGQSQVQFTGIAAGDASTESAVIWTRALDPAVLTGTQVTAHVSTDPRFGTGTIVASAFGTPGSATGYTIKFEAGGLNAGTRYYYRFLGPVGETSAVGTFKTAPAADAETGLHFAFSGDCDGLMRPYALSSQIPAKQLDFFMFD